MAEEKLASNNGQPQIVTSIQDFDPPKKPKRNKYAIACSFLASLASILLGYGKNSLPFHLSTSLFCKTKTINFPLDKAFFNL